MSTRSSKLGGTSGGVISYLKDESRTLAEYYDGFTDVWGKAAHTLGIESGITREQFDRLFHGQDPHTGEQLARVRHKTVTAEYGTQTKVAERTPMIDVVFGTPKSLSELMLASTPEMREKIVAVVKEAAHEAFNITEREAKLARVPAKLAEARVRSDGRTTAATTERVPADLIAVPVVQFTARDTDTTLERGVADPHLHVHVPIFTLCQANDRWYTADEFGLKNETNAKLRDAVFLGELARGLESLGVEIEYNQFDRAKKGEVAWEVKGSKAEIRKHWSTNTERAWEIRRAYEEEHGKPLPEEQLKMELYKTRKAKSADTKAQDSNPVWERWEEDLEQAGMKLAIPEPGKPIERNTFQAADELRKRLLGSNGFVRDDALFDQDMIKGSIRRCSVGLQFTQQELDGLEHIFLTGKGRDLVVMRDAVEAEHRLYTTQTLLDAEAQIAQKREQLADRWVDITGPAGTGKSRSLGVAIEVMRSIPDQSAIPHAYHPASITDRSTSAAKAESVTESHIELNAGQQRAVDAMVRATGEAPDQVIVVSMAATTAEMTGRKVRADQWGSVDSVLARIERKAIKPTDRTLIVIEEAGQLGTLQADRLLKAVGNARIVTLGDHKQLSAIGAAGWYTDALSRHDSVELSEVRRQAEQQDVQAYDLVRRGKAPEALQDLNERGRVHVAQTDGDRMAAMQAKYEELRDAGAPSRHVRMVMDSSNLDVDTANRFIQRYRLEHDEIGQQAVTVDSGERRWELRDNDEVIMLESVRVKGEDPIKNGKTGKIMRVDDRMNVARIRFDDGREATLPVSGAIGLGYGVHIQKYQGNECEFALYAPGRGATQNSSYTALTRGVVESHVFISGESNQGLDGLAKQWQRADERQSATKTLAELRAQEEVRELPPVRSDELTLDDIKLDDIPPLDPVPALTAPRIEQQELIEPQLVEPTLDQDLSLERDIGGW